MKNLHEDVMNLTCLLPKIVIKKIIKNNFNITLGIKKSFIYLEGSIEQRRYAEKNMNKET